MSDALDTVTPDALALPAADVRSPSMPVGTFIEEARAMLDHVEADTAVRDRLLKTRVKAADLKLLRTLADALEQAQRRWNRLRTRVQDQARLDIIAQAEELRADILLACDYNTADDRIAIARLASIREGDGLTDLLEDLLDLQVFIHDYAAPLREDALFDEAEAHAALTRTLDALRPLASAQHFDAERVHTLDLRDRVYTLALNLTRQVREGGRRAFSHAPNRLSIFQSRYEMTAQRRYRRRQKDSTTPES
jgi:hypothetical protein